MTRNDVVYAVDKVTILTYAKQHDTVGCHYYDMAINQLLSELEKDAAKELLKSILTKNSTSMQAITATNTILNNIIKG